MTEDLIEVYRNSQKLMPLVHLPVQSGSDKILKLMNRKHVISDYIKIYEKLKSINSNIEFSSDFIIAYPGEDEQDFNETFELIKNIKFINSFSFIFSPRPGTKASNLKLLNEPKLQYASKYIWSNFCKRTIAVKIKFTIFIKCQNFLKILTRTAYN